MNRQTAAFLKWAGIMLIFANVMAWEGMYLARRWRPPDAVEHARSLREASADVTCPDQKIVHTKCAPCQCRIKEKERLETDLGFARAQQEDCKRQLAAQQADMKSLRATAKARDAVSLANPEVIETAVLIATPVKNSADKLVKYFANLQQLTYSKELTSLAFIVSDSLDLSARGVRDNVKSLKGVYRRATVLQRDFGYQQAPDPKAVPTAEDEAYRRAILARSRNFLLFEALHDEGWVLWLDVDIVKYPNNLLELLLRHEPDIATTACVMLDDAGAVTEQRCDAGSWAETNASRAYVKTLEDPALPLFEGFGDQALQGTRLLLSNDSNVGKETVNLDAVGATVTLVKADLHRDGLLFPHVMYEHLIEAEALGKMAVAAGFQPIGLPDLVVHHAAVHIKPQPTWRR